MPHREDLEAALERLAALERDLEERGRRLSGAEGELAALRAELESVRVERDRLRARRPPAPAKKGRRPKHRDAEPRPRSPSAWDVIKVPIGIALVGLVVTAGATLHRRQRLAKQPAARAAVATPRRVERAGTLEHAHLVRDARGGELLLLTSSEDTSYGPYHLDLVELATGKRRGRLTGLHRRPDVHGAAPGRFWNGLEIWDVDRLEPIVTAAELKQRIPALAAGTTGTDKVDFATGDRIVTTRTGDTLLLDSARATARPLGTRIPEGGRIGWFGNDRTTTPSAGSTVGALLFDGSQGPKQALVRFDGRRYVPLSDEAVFLSPVFVQSCLDGQALRFPSAVAGAGDLLVAHADLLGEANELRLSRVSLQGRIVWTVKDAPGRVHFGHRSAGLVVVAVEGRRGAPSYALGIDAETGTRRWRYPL